MEAFKTGNRNEIPSQEIGLPAVEAGRSHNRRTKRMRERTDDRCEMAVVRSSWDSAEVATDSTIQVQPVMIRPGMACVFAGDDSVPGSCGSVFVEA